MHVLTPPPIAIIRPSFSRRLHAGTSCIYRPGIRVFSSNFSYLDPIVPLSIKRSADFEISRLRFDCSPHILCGGRHGYVAPDLPLTVAHVLTTSFLLRGPMPLRASWRGADLRPPASIALLVRIQTSFRLGGAYLFHPQPKTLEKANTICIRI